MVGVRPLLATQHRIIYVNANRKTEVVNFIRNHPLLNPLGGTEDGFPRRVALLGDPDDASVVRAYVAGWILRPQQWETLRDFLVGKGWKINTPDADNDITHYLTANWTLAETLADQTRKGFKLKAVPIYEDI